MATELLESYTVRDYQAWEGDWELIQGQPMAMTPSPGLSHQRLGAHAFRAIDAALGNCPECEVLFEMDWQVDEETVLRPDLVVICHTEGGERITRAPELIVEIVSPDRPRRDEVIKYDLYQHEAVGYYILAYPDMEVAKAYELVEGAYRKLGDFHDERPTLHLAGCSIELDFAWLWRRKDQHPPKP